MEDLPAIAWIWGAPDYKPRGGTTYNGLGPPPSVTNEETALQGWATA
ncbi:rCG26494 [Rattus norvegicus]|uniref:RCG26494 n=1 Tax=Rattus norvegicus TaxID=10116 RepID=A6HM80_RAT|nr:rCG26494 [Rattus norvegicus]